MSGTQDAVRDLLDDVVREDAHAVRFDAATAWRRGRRRRITDILSVAAAVVVLIGVGLALTSLVFGMTPALTPASGPGDVASKYPARLDYTYWDDDMPRETGPLAGVVHRYDVDGSGWYAVSPAGHLWKLDMENDIEPALSPDGSHLGYMPGDLEKADYTIANQLDGTSVTFPLVGAGAINADGSPTHEYFFSMQSPAFWSPDSDELLLRISETDHRDPDHDPDPAAAILGIDGSMTMIPRLPGAGGNGANPVGWIDGRRVALVAEVDAVQEIRVWIVDARTGESERSFFLEKKGARSGSTSQWFGRLSPDGGRLARPANAFISRGGDTRLYSMTSNPPGALTENLPGVSSAAGGCSTSWTSSDLYLPAMSTNDDDATESAAVLVRADGEVAVVADPRLNIICSVWARAALDGGAHHSWGSRLFGDHNNWLSWHWRELSLSVLLGAALLAGVVLVRHRRWRVRSR